MRCRRIVVDTNVLISSVLFGGPPRKVLEVVICGKVRCSISPAILAEVREVISRPKFGFPPAAAFLFLEELQAICDVCHPSVRIHAVKTDPDDNAILECAVESGADAIVSGDRHLLDLEEFKNIRILSPSDFLESMT